MNSHECEAQVYGVKKNNKFAVRGITQVVNFYEKCFFEIGGYKLTRIPGERHQFGPTRTLGARKATPDELVEEFKNHPNPDAEFIVVTTGYNLGVFDNPCVLFKYLSPHN